MTTTFSDLQAKARTGWETLMKGEPPRILVGTATCGRAAGGLQVLEALGEALSRAGIEAEVHQVGCIGLCYAEVLVDIIKPENLSVNWASEFDKEVLCLLKEDSICSILLAICLIRAVL